MGIEMEFSLETPTNQANNSTYKKQKVDKFSTPSKSCQIVDENDIIDVSKLNLNDDENWLFECCSNSDIDLQKWLSLSDDLAEILPNDRDFHKNIDTRTFTRPKKRFTRPSIEKYNEELYGNELTDSGIQLNGCSQEDDGFPKPVQFDLTQPISSSYYFDNVLANAAMADSFQNMSPPSLVNSMCSSTFANLMENSFIKNDPVLREIRDTDYTGLILQQESEPMFQSITESCSSLNSDIPDNLLKKISFNEKNSSNSDVCDATVILNTTFARENSSSNDTIILGHHEDFQEDKAASCENLNNTFSKKLESTYKVSEINNGTIKLNNTFQRRKVTRLSVLSNQESPKEDLNSTITIEPIKLNEEKPFESVKRLLDRRPSPSLDLNRLSYQIDKHESLNQTYPNVNAKRNSIESSDSTDNLDYMSLSSGSSKNSSKRLSMDGINAIVEMQERSLQVMSTPKPKNRTQIMWHNNEISPISGRNSDPELSSSEKVVDVRPVIAQNTIKKQKSMGNINSRMPQPRGMNMVSQLAAVKNHIRGSQPNLKINETRTYAPQKPSNLETRTYAPLKPSNLNSMGHTLKGSYTSLKPINPNLPVAPPPLDTTVTRHPTVAQVLPTPRDNALKRENAQFVKPQVPRSSGLPRPVTGIPRPASRIPGPRSVRPVSRSAGQQGRQTSQY